MTKIELSEKECRLLLQSLDHCLATCQKKTVGGNQPCEDCAAATLLRGRIAELVEK
jgi:hypothetical protein